MKLATGLATVEDFATGEYHEKYRVAYETQSRDKLLDAVKWFVESPYRKVLVIPDSQYKQIGSLRGLLAERLKMVGQPKDCFVSVVQKRDRVFLEKT